MRIGFAARSKQPLLPTRLTRNVASRSATFGKSTALNLSFSQEADADLDAIKAHIAQDSPAAAEAIIARILQSIAILENFPLIGRLGRVDATREFSITNLPFFAVYEITSETDITVLRIIHTSRLYPFKQS